VLPALPMHGGDRNRTSPFAFTGNKFEFRALGSSMSLALPNTVLNTIVAEAIDDLADKLERPTRRPSLEEASSRRQGRLDAATSGSSSTATTTPRSGTPRPSARPGQPAPDARRAAVAVEPSTVDVFSKYEVLSERELESRYEVVVEQYTTTINIEGETAAAIARTMLLPGGDHVARHARRRRRHGIAA
jgi:glutamine synthetase